MLLEVETLFKGAPGCIYLSSEGFRSSGLKEGDELSLWAGANEHKVKAQKLDSIANNILYVPDELYENLKLPRCHRLSALIEPGKKSIKIGPFLGFLIIHKRQSKKPPYSNQRVILETFSAMALKKGLIPLVFAPQDIDWSNKKISAHTLQQLPQGNYQWVKEDFPFPNAVYNRIMNRSTERKDLIRDTVNNLNTIPNLHHFNPKFLEKWETHEILNGYPTLRRYLPETSRVRRLKDIADIAAKYPTVYVKPINGSLGTNIVRLEAIPEGYRYQYRRNRKDHIGLWKDPETMWSELRDILGRRQYIVQQGLDFKRFQGRVFDVRLLIQKDMRGCWTTTAVVGRIAAGNNIFPNIAAGGEAKRIEEVWQEISIENWENSDVYRQVLDIGSKTAAALEKELGNFAELGLDIGIDSNNRAWLIEVNSKPSRKVFPKERPDLKMNSMKNIINYSKHVSGFANLKVNAEYISGIAALGEKQR